MPHGYQERTIEKRKMGSGSSELSLDFKPSFMPKTISAFLREVSGMGDQKKRVARMEEYVACLEEERRKIDAFKRELPLSIEILREEEMQCRFSNGTVDSKARPVLEEFMPIKSKLDDDRGGVKKEKDCKDKINWMSSAQLWSDSCRNDNNSNKKIKTADAKEKVEENDQSVDENAFVGCNYKTGGGAFIPFKGLSSFPISQRREEKEALPIPDLSLLSPGIKTAAMELGAGNSSSKSSSRAVTSSATATGTNGQPNSQLQPPRKARRCWSPELHRRFVNALQQLGGSQVATPKQIRELMKVDGLTNDEVKSHLQKYRLHTRRLPASTAAPANQQVVLGGLWNPHDHYQASKESSSQSGSPQGPLQLAAASRGISTCGDSGEDDDGRSESYSWKGHHQRQELLESLPLASQASYSLADVDIEYWDAEATKGHLLIECENYVEHLMAGVPCNSSTGREDFNPNRCLKNIITVAILFQDAGISSALKRIYGNSGELGSVSSLAMEKAKAWNSMPELWPLQSAQKMQILDL
ncbi:hypothetical protein ACLOJK_003052 [Asimina triloba]